MPLYPNNYPPLEWASSVEQEINGAGNNQAVQPFNAAGAFDTIAANMLKANDRIILRAEFEVTGQNTTTNVIPNIYWGGAASGIALFNTGAVITAVNGIAIELDAEITFRTVGSSPVWGYFAKWRVTSNSSYTAFKKAWGLTSIPTSVSVPVEASVCLFNGTATATDKVMLRNFRRRIVRA